MPAVIAAEHPASPDATVLIAELDAHLTPVCPSESRHGFSVQKLIADAVAFFVIRDGGAPAGCGRIKLFGTEYGEITRMWVRPQFRGLGFGKLMLDHLANYAKRHGVAILRWRPAFSSMPRSGCTNGRALSVFRLLGTIESTRSVSATSAT